MLETITRSRVVRAITRPDALEVPLHVVPLLAGEGVEGDGDAGVVVEGDVEFGVPVDGSDVALKGRDKHVAGFLDGGDSGLGDAESVRDVDLGLVDGASQVGEVLGVNGVFGDHSGEVRSDVGLLVVGEFVEDVVDADEWLVAVEYEAAMEGVSFHRWFLSVVGVTGPRAQPRRAGGPGAIGRIRS